jgi:hypothetical protein
MENWYEEPNHVHPCMFCKYINYDSFHHETWCGHPTPPQGLNSRLIVDKWGTCDSWKDSEAN